MLHTFACHVAPCMMLIMILLSPSIARSEAPVPKYTPNEKVNIRATYYDLDYRARATARLRELEPQSFEAVAIRKRLWLESMCILEVEWTLFKYDMEFRKEQVVYWAPRMFHAAIESILSTQEFGTPTGASPKN